MPNIHNPNFNAETTDSERSEDLDLNSGDYHYLSDTSDYENSSSSLSSSQNLSLPPEDPAESAYKFLEIEAEYKRTQQKLAENEIKNTVQKNLGKLNTFTFGKIDEEIRRLNKKYGIDKNKRASKDNRVSILENTKIAINNKRSEIIHNLDNDKYSQYKSKDGLEIFKKDVDGILASNLKENNEIKRHRKPTLNSLKVGMSKIFFCCNDSNKETKSRQNIDKISNDVLNFKLSKR